MNQAQRSLATPMTGGWSASNLDDPMILEAAGFCLTALQSNVADDELTKPKFSFVPTPSSTAKVIRASQQVVAGMNYRLTIMVQEAGVCVGAFEATVYNRFGSLSVTEWNKEISCSEGKILLEVGEKDETRSTD